MILAGDIGGTKSLLAFFSPDGGPRAAVNEQSLPSRNYPGLEAVLQDFLRTARKAVKLACFGVPGPVVEGRCETPNLPWRVDARELRRVVGSNVVLINDLEATGCGIATLRPDEFVTLNEGNPSPGGNAALIAPGTGLGEAILFWDGREHHPSASEGGHADFAPRNEQEIDLLRYLLKRYPHVSYDQVVTGRGLKQIYDSLRDTGGKEPEWLKEELARADDPAPVISRAALEKRDALCGQALNLWVSIFGAEAGNLALKALATAGVYLGGGIAPKLLDKLKDGTFLAAFRDKGRLSSLVAQMPVRVILNEKTALYGAAAFALSQAQKISP